MSQRRNKDDEDSGWGRLLAIGAGIAGVAGAIYVGKQVYDSVQEENKAKEKLAEKERALREEEGTQRSVGACGGAGWSSVNSGGACGGRQGHMRTVPKKGSYGHWEEPEQPSLRSRSPETLSFTSSSRLSTQPRLAAPENTRPLQEALEDYYDAYVDIPYYKMARAQNVVDYVKDAVLTHLQAKSKLKVTHLVNAGSTSEGLKVINPDEFDVQIFLAVDNDVLYIDEDTNVPDYVLVKYRNPEDSTYKEFKPVQSRLFLEGIFDPRRVRSYFQGEIQKIANGISRYNVTTSTAGPAFTLNVTYDDDTKMSIDLVPVVVIDGKEIVAKPHPKFHKERDEQYAKYWRWSFTKQEKATIERFPQDACHRKCLKIMKAIRENHPGQLGKFRSYIFKTALLHMMDEHEVDEWEEQQLSERFVDFLQYFIGCLGAASLPHYFVEDLNIFEDMPVAALKNSRDFLLKQISKGKVHTLLKSDKKAKL